MMETANFRLNNIPLHSRLVSALVRCESLAGEYLT
jgi:hypothetical protein